MKRLRRLACAAVSPDAQPSPQAPLPFVLGDPGPLRDRLVAAVLAGEKTTTASLLEEYVDEPLPAAGERFRMIDSAGADVAIVEVTAVEIFAMGEATLAFAVAEGEGFTSVAEWRAAHEAFWLADPDVAALGITLSDETQIVGETFRVVELT